MFEKVFIVSASVGAGHMRAAEALERAFLERGAAREVRHVDILEHTTKLLRAVYADGYSWMVRHVPALTSWLYDALNSVRERPSLFDRLNTRRFLRMVHECRPELVVCTHFLPAEILSWAEASNESGMVLATVLTDFDAHARWICAGCGHYFVAADEARAQLETAGIDPDRITVSGIPIDPVFSKPRNRGDWRRKHGLHDDHLTILVSGARLGWFQLERIVHSLSTLRRRAHVLMLCGRNDEVRHVVDRTIARVPRSGAVDFRTYGFTPELHELMSVSDILLGRPGGLTTSEGLAAALVFVVVGAMPGNEKRTADYLLEQGAGMRCNDLSILSHKIERLVGDPERFQSMKRNAFRLGQPRAASAIVDKLFELRESGCSLGPARNRIQNRTDEWRSA